VSRSIRRALLAAAVAAASATLLAQASRDVAVVKEQKPVYPEAALKTRREGNVLLVGRIDERGILHDVTTTAATLAQFVDPAVTAARAWQFRPAVKDGRPVEVAANLAFQFRINDEKRGTQFEGAWLGDIRIVPADSAGKPAGPDGFPIRRAAGERIRVEAGLDVVPQELGRSIDAAVQAVSPTGKVRPVWSDRVTVGPKADRAGIAFTAEVGPDWSEDGVWRLRFLADQKDAGTAIVWVASNPSSFDFASAMKKLPAFSPPR
jgi:TonB family protein